MIDLLKLNSLLLAILTNALIIRPSFVPLLLPFLHFEPIPSLQRRGSASAS